MGRLQMQAELLTIAPEAWYQKPPSNRMHYPCFVYKAVEPSITRADNRNYLTFPCYEVIYISQTENDAIWETMGQKFGHCTPGRKYVSDSLFHYPFTIYYQ